MLAEHRLSGVRLKHRGLSLLDLQDHQVIVVAPTHEQDEGKQSHATDAHHLVAKVDDLVAPKKYLPILLQR